MNDAALETIARNVRAARTATGLSLDALSERADVSKGALVALEGARGNPNLTTLVRLADALGQSVSSLMEDAPQALAVTVDVDGIEPLWRGSRGGVARLVLTTPRPAPVELWRWVLHPGEGHESSPHQPGVSETLSVVRGQMKVLVDGEEHPLRAGMSIAFPGDVPHVYEGTGRGPCEFVMTVHLPSDVGAGRA